MFLFPQGHKLLDLAEVLIALVVVANIAFNHGEALIAAAGLESGLVWL